MASPSSSNTTDSASSSDGHEDDPNDGIDGTGTPSSLLARSSSSGGTQSKGSEIWKPLAKVDFSGRKMRNSMDIIRRYGEQKLRFTPHDWQINTAAAVMNGLDVVCIARTGDGKSAVFQLLTADAAATHIVISPLLGLIDEQVCVGWQLSTYCNAYILQGPIHEFDRGRIHCPNRRVFTSQ
jgi:hypothetical protein